MPPKPEPPWPPAVVQAVSDVLAATEWPGLSGSEIGRLLSLVNIDDINAPDTKRHRLAAALLNRQAQDRTSNRLVTFVTQAMATGRYLQDPARFSQLQQDIDEALSLVGLRVTDEGRVSGQPKPRRLIKSPSWLAACAAS